MFDEKTCRKTKTELERDLTMRTEELSDKVEICKSQKELDKITCSEKIEELEDNQVKDGSESCLQTIELKDQRIEELEIEIEARRATTSSVTTTCQNTEINGGGTGTTSPSMSNLDSWMLQFEKD